MATVAIRPQVASATPRNDDLKIDRLKFRQFLYTEQARQPRHLACTLIEYMSLRLEVIFALLCLMIPALALADAVAARPEQIISYEVQWLNGGDHPRMDLRVVSAFPAMPDGLDATQMEAFRTKLSLNDQVNASDELARLQRKIDERLIWKKMREAELVTAVEPRRSEVIRELGQLNSDLQAFESFKKLFQDNQAMAAGQGMASGMRGGHVGSGGGGGLLAAVVIGGAIGAGVALAASGGGGGNSSAPPANSNADLAKAQQAAEQDFRNRMILEGQLVELGQQRTIDFHAMDAQFLGLVTTPTTPAAPAPYVPYAAPPVY